MSLTKLCQPLIDYMAEIHFLATKDKELDINEVRSTLDQFFENMYDKVSDDPQQAAQMNKLTLPLVFFLDYIIKEGPFNFASDWKEMALQFDELSGDDKFFDIFDETLHDPSGDAEERLKVLYRCLSAGFSGGLRDLPKNIEKKIKACAIRLKIDRGDRLFNKITESSYRKSDTEKKFIDPLIMGRKYLLYTVSGFLVILICTIGVYYYLTFPLRVTLTECVSHISSFKGTTQQSSDKKGGNTPPSSSNS